MGKKECQFANAVPKLMALNMIQEFQLGNCIIISTFFSKPPIVSEEKTKLRRIAVCHRMPENQDSMEVQKRKCLDDGEIETKKQKKTEKYDGMAEETAVEENEVEEFYAILRRTRVAVKYFQKGNGNSDSGRKLTVETLLKEDFGEVNGVKVQERTEDNAGLDLNADPDGL
ncbi:hypothetical protein K7X08_006715 [Anisodus acutangulus]|uniref:Uncharacterized protein n=1 Tax=Anisodus acutangulus TaxID=402998 RepID=A0A9Q1MX15_9SOLA|nr:hypothetical protein K7X08_006715 [Anisodus acutangulus]